MGAMMTVGIPYFLTFAALLLISVKGRLETFEKWWFYSPFLMALMAGVCALGVTVLAIFSERWNAGVIPIFFAVVFFCGLSGLILGYAYVLLAAWILCSSGLGTLQAPWTGSDPLPADPRDAALDNEC